MDDFIFKRNIEKLYEIIFLQMRAVNEILSLKVKLDIIKSSDFAQLLNFRLPQQQKYLDNKRDMPILVLCTLGTVRIQYR